MFHSNTELLIDYWRAQKGLRRAPVRASINPGEFASLLPQVFILGRVRPGSYAFRLIGGLVEDDHRLLVLTREGGRGGEQQGPLRPDERVGGQPEGAGQGVQAGRVEGPQLGLAELEQQQNRSAGSA